nr:NADH dehydrogenase subunit 2 [Bangiopsis subsimplex]
MALLAADAALMVSSMLLLAWLSYAASRYWLLSVNAALLISKQLLLAVCYAAIALIILLLWWRLSMASCSLAYGCCFSAVVAIMALLWLSLSIALKNSLLHEHVLSASMLLLAAVLLPRTLLLAHAYAVIELLALSSYVLVCCSRLSEFSVEAALKYYLLGAASSLLFVAGAVFYMLATGSYAVSHASMLFNAALEMPSLNIAVAMDAASMAFSLIAAAFCFKLAIVPMHSWLPEVYDGANAVICMLLISLPKNAYMAWMSLLLYDAASHAVSSQLLYAASISCIAVAATSASMQLSWKRLLALSGSVHAGYMLLALHAQDELMHAAILLYCITYSVLALAMASLFAAASQGSFFNAALISCRAASRYISELKALAIQQPFYAASIVLLAFNMIGLPPLLGFHAKLLVLLAYIGAAHIVAAIIAFAAKVCASLYYMRVLSIVLLPTASKLPHTMLPSRGVSLYVAAMSLLSMLPYAKSSLLMSSLQVAA